MSLGTSNYSLQNKVINMNFVNISYFTCEYMRGGFVVLMKEVVGGALSV